MMQPLTLISRVFDIETAKSTKKPGFPKDQYRQRALSFLPLLSFLFCM